MNIRAKLLVIAIIASSCEPQMSDDPIPWLAFPDVEINLNMPEYFSLRVDHGIKEYHDAGVRGIIIYRVDANTFRAYERNCTFSPNDAGATVNVHSSMLYLVDHSCGSTFTLDEGTPINGPAWRPLRQYKTSVANNILTITDEAIN